MDKHLEVGEKTRILVLELANGSLGLIVDSVQGVISIPEAQIEPLPVAGNDLGEQIAAVDERLIMLIDPERALGSALPEQDPGEGSGQAPEPPEQRLAATCTVNSSACASSL